jgi:hypothetical protein
MRDEEGSPAQKSCQIKEADFLFGNCYELEDWVLVGHSNPQCDISQVFNLRGQRTADKPDTAKIHATSSPCEMISTKNSKSTGATQE